MRRPILAATAAFMIATPLAVAATLNSSFDNNAVSNYDLDAQGYADWARWDTSSTTATVERTGGSILDRTLGATGNARSFNSAHTFVQGSSNNNMVAREKTGASLTASFSLEAGTEYSIDIFTRVIPITVASGRNDVQVTATFGATTDVFVIDDDTQTNDSGAGVYTLQVSDLAEGGTLTIELFALFDDDTVDTSSNVSVRLGAIGVDALGPPDTTPPSLVLPTSPQDDATGVPVISNLVATFDELIDLEDGGTITLDDLGSGPDTLITLPDPQVSVVGLDLIIEPATPLNAGANYAVLISSDAVKDFASTPNFFAGISDTSTWNFQTNTDGTGPVIVPPTTPADDASDVAIDSNLVANFDETLVVGSGNITIKNLSASTETVIPIGDSQVTVSSTTLTINPTADLAPSANYAVRIAAGTLTDSLGNPFLGIDDDTTWNFVTAADTTNPTLVSLSPADNGAIRATGSLVATFSEEVTVPAPTVIYSEDFEGGTGSYQLDTTSGSDWEYGTPDSFNAFLTINSGNNAASGEGSCWGVNLGTYAGGTGDPGYFETVGAGDPADTDTCLRSAPIDLTTASGGASLTFAQAVDLATTDSAEVYLIDNATGIRIPGGPIYSTNAGSASWAITPEIDLTAGLGKVVRIEWCLTGSGGTTYDYLGWYIDDVIVSASAGGGVTVKNLTAGTEAVYGIGNGEVSIAGDTLTITPSAPLEVGDQYAVQIGAGVVTDLSRNPFAGILDDTTWNFTVAATLNLTVVADTYLRKNQPTTNQNDDPDNELLIGVISSGNDVLRILLRFDTSSLAALEDLEIVGATLVGKNRDANGAGGALTTITAHDYGFAFVEDGATWNDPDGDGSGESGDATPGGTIGTTVASAANHSTGANAQAVFTSNAALITLIEQALAGTHTLNLLLKRDPEPTGTNSYARFSDEDQPEPFRLEIDYLATGGVIGNDFATWIAGFSGLNGQTAVNDDPDGDGIGNGVENFFGTAPNAFSQGLLVSAVDPGAGTFTFTHPQNATPADDLTAVYQWSTDLASFHGNGVENAGTTVSFSASPNTPETGITTVTATVAGTPVSKLFVNVKVTQN